MPAASASSATQTPPARAEMDAGTLILARAVYVRLLRKEAALTRVSGENLLAAGNAACDAMDRGDSFRSVLIVAGSLATGATTTESIAALVGTASGTLCPEHAHYTD